MTVKKRGLGRGLEALLVDVSAKEDKASLHHGNLPSDTMNSDELQKAPGTINKITDAEIVALALIETMHQENINLLQEAIALRELVDEFAAMIRHL